MCCVTIYNNNACLIADAELKEAEIPKKAVRKRDDALHPHKNRINPISSIQNLIRSLGDFKPQSNLEGKRKDTRKSNKRSHAEFQSESNDVKSIIVVPSHGISGV